MHGGSGSTDQEIKTSVEAGVIKMNVDTDTQWVSTCYDYLILQTNSAISFNYHTLLLTN